MSYITIFFIVCFHCQFQNLDIDFAGKGISILYKYDTLGFKVIPVLVERGRMLLAGISNMSFVNSKVIITKLNAERSFDIDVEDILPVTIKVFLIPSSNTQWILDKSVIIDIADVKLLDISGYIYSNWIQIKTKFICNSKLN